KANLIDHYLSMRNRFPVKPGKKVLMILVSAFQRRTKVACTFNPRNSAGLGGKKGKEGWKKITKVTGCSTAISFLLSSVDKHPCRSFILKGRVLRGTGF